MPNRVMFLNIYRGREFDASFQEYIDSRFQESPEVVVRSFDERLRNSEPRYLHQVGLHQYESLTLADTLHKIVECESEGFDAAVIGCYCDPALVEARETVNQLVVTGPAESSMLLAMALGRRFSTLVTTRTYLPPMLQTVTSYGFRDRLASIRTIDVSIQDLQTDREATLSQLERVARRAVDEDHADVIILGCTDFFGLHEDLGEALGKPVIDSVLASVAFADYLADVKRRLGYGYVKVAT